MFISNRPLQIIMGGRSDTAVAKRVLEGLEKAKYYSCPVHIISCHRHLFTLIDFTKSFNGKLIVVVGGKNLQHGAVLDSIFRELGKHVVIVCVPAGSTEEEIAITIVSMQNLPYPCFIHYLEGNTQEILDQEAPKWVGFVEGTRMIDGERKTDWEQRLATHKSQTPSIDIKI